MTDLVVFDYQNAKVRVVKDEQGEPLFVAKDVADLLGYANSRKAVKDHCKHGRAAGSNESFPLDPQTILIPEGDVFRLIMKSKLPAAEKFEEWVMDEVIPSIRQYGKYVVPQSSFKLPSTFSEALRLAADLQDKVEAQEKRLAIAAPKEAFFDAVADSKTAIDMGSAAKVLDCGIGRNSLFQMLRDHGILMDNNQPYQTFVDRGYFRVVEQKYLKPDGSQCVSTKTLVFQNGLNYILRTLKLTPRKIA